MNVGEPEIFLTNQTVESPIAEPPTRSIPDADASEMRESVFTLLGGVSGLLFALSLSFFLQAPFVSGGVLLALLTGWLGAAFYTPDTTEE